MNEHAAIALNQEIHLTRHAGIRVQQRGVPIRALLTLLDYGHSEPDHKGCQVVTLDASAWDEVPGSDIGHLNGRRLYAVVDADGVVITAGHRYRRIPRDLSLSSYRPGRTRRQGRSPALRNAFCQ